MFRRRGQTVVRKRRSGPAVDLELQLLSWVPPRLAYSAAAARGRRRYRRARLTLDGTHPTILRESLDATPEQLQAWAAREFEDASCDEVGWLKLAHMTRDNLDAYVDIRGLDRLEEALSAGRGAILYSGHHRGQSQFFGALGVLGLKPHVVVNQPLRPGTPERRRRLFERRDALLTELGCRFLYLVDGALVAVRAVNALRRNEVVSFAIDHSMSPQNVETLFMGRPAQFPLGPLLVAQSAGARFHPYWAYRPKERTPVVVEIGDPIEHADDPAEMVRRLMAPLEENIRRHPESWATWLFDNAHFWLDRNGKP